MIGWIGAVRSVCVRVCRGVIALALAVSVIACGNGGISGEYVGQPGAWVDKLTFGPGNEVRAVQRGDAAVGIGIEGKVMPAISTRSSRPVRRVTALT